MARGACKAHSIVNCDRCTDEAAQEAAVERMRANAAASRAAPTDDTEEDEDN